MIIRQLKQDKYDCLHRSLMQKAHATPMDASYMVNMAIDSTEYALKVQPESHCKIAILQALRIDRDKCAPKFELITKGNLLSSLLEILIYQGVRD